MVDGSDSIRMLGSTRVEFDDSLTEGALRDLVERPKVRVLQCSSPVSDRVWVLLNECFFAARPDVELRVYGHYSLECDLKLALRMKNVRRYSSDCLARQR